MSQIVKVGINVTRLGVLAVRKEPIVTALYARRYLVWQLYYNIFVSDIGLRNV